VDRAHKFLLAVQKKYDDLCAANEVFNGVFIYLHNCFLKQFDITFADVNKVTLTFIIAAVFIAFIVADTCARNRACSGKRSTWTPFCRSICRASSRSSSGAIRSSSST
jgi:hypothetical protein